MRADSPIRDPISRVVARGVGSFAAHPFPDPTYRFISTPFDHRDMEPNPTCPNCGALVDLTRRNAVTSVIYRHVMCRACGVICILEGPERNVANTPSEPPPA